MSSHPARNPGRKGALYPAVPAELHGSRDAIFHLLRVAEGMNSPAVKAPPCDGSHRPEVAPEVSTAPNSPWLRFFVEDQFEFVPPEMHLRR
ncbi:hypothetical protein [Pseudoruegeria sp. HB172150]|uniref:hypothetical protein n=1 Tax=Pseudoruegeria sp. HB172150 TaxID=2721164 RepID=UPI001552557F|nr:hypothetical protein [Pseudoruegeria sp. HB172150]